MTNKKIKLYNGLLVTITMETKIIRLYNGEIALEGDENIIEDQGVFFTKDDPYADKIVNHINNDGSVNIKSLKYIIPCKYIHNSRPLNMLEIPIRRTVYGLPILCVEGNDSLIYYYFNEELLNDEIFFDYYTEDIKTGIFYHKKLLSKVKINNKKEFKTYYVKSKEISASSFLNEMKEKNIPYTYRNLFGKKYTFGVEIETISGYVPQYLFNKLHCTAVHDGSLRVDGEVYGGEYVTSVLKGDMGLLILKQLDVTLEKYCMINKQCGVHVHLGDAVFSKENIVLLWYICQLIENDVFNMLPHSRRNNEYCRKLDKIEILLDNIKKDRDFYINYYYHKIVKILSRKDDVLNKLINKKRDHPAGFKCGYNHNYARYCWVNFNPAVFNTRDNGIYTIEFRPMSATLSYYKTKMWLLICMGILDVVENFKINIYNNEINNIYNIIDLSYSNKGSKINDYIKNRIDKFSIVNKSQSIINQIELSDYEETNSDKNFSLKNL